MSEQTGEPRQMRHGILTWAHRSDSPRKIRTRGDQVGPADPPGSAEPGRPPVQVHFEEQSPPSLLITFHACIWWEPTSTSINRAPTHPTQHTHTHTSFHSLQEGSPLSCSLS